MRVYRGMERWEGARERERERQRERDERERESKTQRAWD